MENFNLTPNSKEYITNGHYRIDGIDYMSVWTFKNQYMNGVRNDKKTNIGVTLEMDVNYGLVAYKGLLRPK